MESLTTGIGSVRLRPALLAAVGSPACGSTSRNLVQLSVRRASASGDNESWRSDLSWKSSTGFGKATSLLVPRAFPTVGAGRPQTSLQVTAFTPEQAKMVNDSWKLLLKEDAGEHAMKFFLKVFEVAPSVKRMFSFLKDSPVPIEKNPQLKKHALQVLVTTGQAATQLGEKGALDGLMPKLLELGHTHVEYGVVDEHFDVVKYSLLWMLADALPEQWNEEMKEAWSVAFDEIVINIKTEMEVLRAHRPVASVPP